MDRWKIWTEFNQFVCCPSAIEAMFRKSIATCYWNDPIHPGGFFLPRAISLPRRYAQRYTATEIQYPTPGKNALGCHASRKFTDWSMSPDTPYPPTSPPPPPGTMILDFMRRLTRRENFQPFLSSRFLFSSSSSSSTFHPSEGEEGAAASNRWKIGTDLGALNGYNG